MEQKSRTNERIISHTGTGLCPTAGSVASPLEEIVWLDSGLILKEYSSPLRLWLSHSSPERLSLQQRVRQARSWALEKSEHRRASSANMPPTLWPRASAQFH